ncbi:hypothetical protein FACS1894182_05230 [Bacteroidia bacterium]|nr:hypothetical protein FACS1894182_05230 [Bacteroidia bacterium]
MNFQILIKQIQSVQSALQSTTAHTINVALTVRNWLIGYYIVEFEQHGEDRAQYGQKLLKNLEKTLKTKGMTERWFREFRRLYLVYPQIGNEISRILPPDTIRRLTAESETTGQQTAYSIESEMEIRRTSAEFQTPENKNNKWSLSAKILLSKLSYSHLDKLSQIDTPIKKVFYEMECIKGCWSIAELERQINTLYYERSGLSNYRTKIR